MTMLQPSDSAPTFVAPSTMGDVDLAEFLREAGVVLYFFPKANTPG
jgi:peroxiredoxin